MSRHEHSLAPDYFDALYARDPDPWRFAASPYERHKYDATLQALPRQRYARALEVGCSIGVLTRRLAERCDELLALDVAEAALKEARSRCADLPHVRFERRHVPAEWPDGRFDLILLSEVVYYLDGDDVHRLAASVDAATLPGAHVVLVHWLGETHYPLTGDEAADSFMRASRAARIAGSRTADYRLDVLAVPA